MGPEDLKKFQEKYPGLLSFLERMLEKFPAVERLVRKHPALKAQVQAQYDSVMKELEHSMKPYRGKFESYANLPTTGRSKKQILADLAKMKTLEQNRWKEGYVSGAVYHGDQDHIKFLNEVYALHSQANPLHSDLWPSSSKFESEIVSMTANMLGASSTDLSLPEAVCGSVTSGGSESIMLAMKAYRDFARVHRGIKKPEMVAVSSAHAAFDKASQFFGIRMRKVPFGSDFRADLKAVKKAINGNTVVVVGSAPTFPHGVIDPIAEMSELAREKGVGFHTDACLGGFMLPWAEKLGYPVPAFDFRLPGVTSMSADTHKYGYAAKGTSVVLYRSAELRHSQFYTITNWPGGMYFSPTLAGSRPGALSAACWAALVSMGEKGYLESAKKILKVADAIKKGIAEIPEIKLLGDPIWILAFASDSLDIYRVMEFMTGRGWNLNGLHRPACVHIALTLRHTTPGVGARFLKDLKSAVKFVKDNPKETGSMAPVYGMAAALPVRSVVGDMLKRYMDVYYKV